MCKRPLDGMVVDGPDIAAASQQHDAKRPGSSADAGALVPYDTAQPADDVEPINAVPLSAIAPPQLPPAPAPEPDEEEPPCLRMVLWNLSLHHALQAHFIAEKHVTGTDLNGQQNRFRIPTDGVLRRLREILTRDELLAANLLHDPAPRPKKRTNIGLGLEMVVYGDTAAAAAAPSQGEAKRARPSADSGALVPYYLAEPADVEPIHAVPLNAIAPQPDYMAVDKYNEAEHQEQGLKIVSKKRKKTGKVHGGLPVKLVDLAAGVSDELLLSRWESSGGTVVKGQGYIDFIQRCSFTEGDTVEIWAFKQRDFCNFGELWLREAPLHLLIVKKDDTHQNCSYCHCEDDTGFALVAAPAKLIR